MRRTSTACSIVFDRCRARLPATPPVEVDRVTLPRSSRSKARESFASLLASSIPETGIAGRVFTAILSIGCSRTSAIELSLVSEGKSVLIAVDDGEQIRAFGYDAGDAVKIELVDPYVGTYPLELTAFSYRATLDAFGLRAGEIAQTGNGIPIPAGELERSVVRGDMVEDWIPIEELGDRLAAVRLESSLTDPVQCLDRGRCFDLEGAGPDACVDCPAPPMPADPIAPNDPDLSRCTWTVIAQMGTRV